MQSLIVAVQARYTQPFELGESQLVDGSYDEVKCR